MNDGGTPPTILVVLGITGDLSHRYLLPALAEVCKAGQLPSKFELIGISRRQLKVDDIFAADNPLKKFASVLQFNFDKKGHYSRLKGLLESKIAAHKEPAQIIFYFAIPPAAVPGIVQNLGEAEFSQLDTKLLLEKPFGTDYASAEKLVNEANKYFKEDQIYRIDHYLAKTMAQNITVFLGSNALFREVWSNQFIESIEVTAAESIGIEGRADFYEATGALRDYQSHLLQLLALVLMEPCSDIFDYDEIPRRRLAALEALQAADPSAAARGQYEGYREEVGKASSKTETFISLRLRSNDPRWTGVPIWLTTGKYLDRKLTAIRVRFKKDGSGQSNLLAIRIQPDEAIEIGLWVKVPGYERKLEKKRLELDYVNRRERLPDAYEQVLIDAMRANHSLFTSSQEVLAAWRVVDPLIKAWQAKGAPPIYRQGAHIKDILGAEAYVDGR